MRVLPRTAQGTWLLAGAVWLAACAGFWWVLPPQPRWTLPGPSSFLGFLADGRTGISIGYDPTTGYQGPIQVWDIPAGRLLASYFGPEDRFRYVFRTRGGRVVLISKDETTSDRFRIRLLDPESGALAEGPHFQHRGDEVWVCFQWGGRLLAYPDETGGGPRIIWYDLEAGEAVGTIPGPSRSSQFSPDGRWFITTDRRGSRTDYRVLEVPGGREQLSIHIPGGGWPHSFSPDGSYLLMEGNWDQNGPGEYRVFDIATGQVRLRLPDDARFFAFAPDSRRLIVEEREPDRGQGIHRQAWLCWYDLTTGEECAPRCPTSAGVWRGGSMARATPDGRYLWVLSFYELPAVYKWLARIPLFRIYGNDPLRDDLQLRETDTGRLIARWPASEAHFNADASLAVAKNFRSGDNAPRVWDVPPRQPITWLAGFAVVSALGLAGLARRRVRKLRRLAEAVA